MRLLDLTDTPSSYAGYAGRTLKVNPTADSVVWSDTPIDAHASRHDFGGADELTLGWKDCRGYASINAAVAAIGVTPMVLIVSNNQTLVGNLSTPATLVVVVLKGGMIINAASNTAEFIGPLMAGRYQIFSGFGLGAITGLKTAKPEWWGAEADDTVVSNVYISSANAALIYGGIVDLTLGTYKATAPIIQLSNTTIKGKGWGTIIKGYGNITTITVTGTAGARKSNAHVEDIKFTANPGDTVQGVGHTYVDDSLVSRCRGEGVTLYGGAATRKCGVVDFSHDGQAVAGPMSWTKVGTDYGEGNFIRNGKTFDYTQGISIGFQKDFVGVGVEADGNLGAYAYQCGFIIEETTYGVSLIACISKRNKLDGFHIEGDAGLANKVSLIDCKGHDNVGHGAAWSNWSGGKVVGGDYWANGDSGIYVHGSQQISITSPNCSGNGDAGIELNNSYLYTLLGGLSSGNAYGIKFTGTQSANIIRGLIVSGNTTADISGLTSGTDWDTPTWVGWTPTLYKSDKTTVIAVGTINFAYKRIGSAVHYQGFAELTAGGSTFIYFTVPIAGSWAGSGVYRMRGMAYGAVKGLVMINAENCDTSLLRFESAAGETYIFVTGSYELA